MRFLDKYLTTLATSLPASLYLKCVQTVIPSLSQASLNYQWQCYVRKRLNSERSPMWASEFYQLTSLVLGFLLLLLSQRTLRPIVVTLKDRRLARSSPVESGIKMN